MGENALNGKYFIKFRKVERARGITLEVPENRGYIEAAVADGWFYGSHIDDDFQHGNSILFHISDLKDCRFYALKDMVTREEKRLSAELRESGLLEFTGGEDGK